MLKRTYLKTNLYEEIKKGKYNTLSKQTRMTPKLSSQR